MKKISLVIVLLFGLCVWHSSAQTSENPPPQTDSHGWGIGIKGSTLGYGFEINHALSSKFVLRASWNNLTFKNSYSIDDISADIDVDLKVGGPSLVADYYFLKKIHLSAGVLYNLLDAKGTIYPKEEYTFGEILLSPEKIGNATLVVEPGSKFSPYLGIGFGRSIALKHRLAYHAEFGSFYQGKPHVKLTATGMLTPTGSDEQNEQLNENLSSYKFYPYLSLMLSFKLIK